MRGDVDGYVAEFNPVGPTGPTVYQKWFTGWNGAPQSNPKPIWRLVGNGRITLDTNKRLPMYQKLDKLLMDERRRDPADLGVEVLRREQAAEEHLRRVHRLQPGTPHGVHRQLGAIRRRRAGDPGPPLALRRSHVSLRRRETRSPRRHVVAISVIIFVLVRLLPGSILDLFFAGDNTATPEQMEARRSSSA